MKPSLTLMLLVLLLASIGCKKSKNTVANPSELRDSVIHLQKQIKYVSDVISTQMLTPGTNYKQAPVQANISEYGALRTQQKETISALSAIDPDTSSLIEMIVCGDFEDTACFSSNWSVSINDSRLSVSFDTAVSYNHSSSLYLNAPFDSTRFNQHGMALNTSVTGILPNTVYKIRFWAKFRGRTSTDNGPTTYVFVYQDGKNLGAGLTAIGDGRTYDEDWQLYSFQIITQSPTVLAAPLINATFTHYKKLLTLYN
ncbi:MAG: hypothetical protein EBZ77_11720 [Chitinophagia bacterium]|nr:hypothetical protein [Chitinophagia bacterium]